ncbi:unnamed protein product [Scytosiphon promiscuus]
MVRLVDGQIVPDDDGDASGGGILGRLVRCRTGTTINLLGFRVPLTVACLFFLFAFLRFGPQGLLLMGVVAVASHFACGGDGGSGGGSGGRRRPFSRGTNVRGIGDLPRPPPSS